MISGRATPEGTQRFAARSQVASGHFRGCLGLTLSSIGLGTYLGPETEARDAGYREAVGVALTRGINVLDTAANYRSQRSERAVGAALAEAIHQGVVARDEVLVSSKAGYLPFEGSRPADLRRYVEETWVKAGVFAWDEVVADCHCLSPRYLSHQLEKSLANLGLATVDVYFLHNPEQQLEEVDRKTFLARIRAAFQALEEAADQGKLAFYGTATWSGYREGLLSLEELLGLARGLRGEKHRFRVVQLPYNLSMQEAKTTGFLDAARAQGLYVMCSASILQGRLARTPAEARKAIQFVRSTPGVGTALVGMSRPEHVEANTALASYP